MDFASREREWTDGPPQIPLGFEAAAHTVTYTAERATIPVFDGLAYLFLTSGLVWPHFTRLRVGTKKRPLRSNKETALATTPFCRTSRTQLRELPAGDRRYLFSRSCRPPEIRPSPSQTG
jgi:hypothetical protein